MKAFAHMWLRFAIPTLALVLALLFPPPTTSRAASQSPIQHVVIVVQENHSFDNVLGRLCHDVSVGRIRRPDGCWGHVRGRLPNGTMVRLTTSPDVAPGVNHSVAGQQKAIDAGRMDGFGRILGCRRVNSYRCYSQYAESQVPNVTKLAMRFAVSDATFELRGTPSWAGHMVLGSATLDGFEGDNPYASDPTKRLFGWGCDSGGVNPWTGIWNGTPYVETPVPSCIPDEQGNLGPTWNTYTGPHASYVPTIFDRLDAAGLSWKLFAGEGPTGRDGYGWTICPTFYDCLSHPTTNGDPNFVASTAVKTAAKDGSLPNLSIVTPTGAVSQHNGQSMAKGDNWIGQVVSAIMNGPDWSSTVIFITWDDCGCFYDHMNPLRYNPEWGIRVPMIMVSPYAKAGYTDHTPATYASLLAFTEHTFGVAALNPCATQTPDPDCTDDAVGPNGQTMYDFSGAFDWTQQPLPPVRMTKRKIPQAEQTYIRSLPHPVGNGT